MYTKCTVTCAQWKVIQKHEVQKLLSGENVDLRKISSDIFKFIIDPCQTKTPRDPMYSRGSHFIGAVIFNLTRYFIKI